MPKGYKVLRKDRTSAITRIGAVHYKKGVETKPKRRFGPLAVFASEVDARNFIDSTWCTRGEKRIIVKCNYIESYHDYVWLYHFGNKVVSGPDFPEGTILASSVTCLE